MQNCVSKKLQRRTPQRVRKSFSKGSSAFDRIMMFFAFKSYVIAGQPFRAQPAKNAQNGGFPGEELKTSTLN